MRLLLVLFALTLAACQPIEKTVYITEAPPQPSTTAPAIPDAPAWAPEVLHVYVLDKTDAILVDETETVENYRLRLYCWQLTAEQQTRDFPTDPWRAVGGGVS